MTRPAQLERAALCDLALDLGPDAPTLCSPWDVAELCAHLVIRERRPDLAIGIVVPAAAGRTERAQSEMAKGDFERLVATVRSGPPIWNPMRIPRLDELANLTEFFVHLEDIRRAGDLGPRTAYGEVGPALESGLERSASMLFRRAAVGITLAPEGGRSFVAKKPTPEGAVTVTGPAPELLLLGFGRGRVAQVDYDGDASAVAALKGSSLGLS